MFETFSKITQFALFDSFFFLGVIHPGLNPSGGKKKVSGRNLDGQREEEKGEEAGNTTNSSASCPVPFTFPLREQKAKAKARDFYIIRTILNTGVTVAAGKGEEEEELIIIIIIKTNQDKEGGELDGYRNTRTGKKVPLFPLSFFPSSYSLFLLPPPLFFSRIFLFACQLGVSNTSLYYETNEREEKRQKKKLRWSV